MGRKRKYENSEERIKRKINKWQEKLAQVKPKRARVIYSSSEENSGDESDVPPLLNSPRPPTPSQPTSPAQSSAPQSSPRQSPSPQSRRSISPRNADTDRAAPPAEEEPMTEDLELDGDILQLLGDAPKVDTALGPPLHKEFASRWLEILAKGLPKEVKDKLLEEYAVPNNCNLLIAPALNPEAKAALSDTLVKRDAFLMQKQRQLGVALSALATAISLVLSNETSKQKLLKPINDACRILCDNHFMDSKSRRNMVISATNSQLKETLLESVRDKSWFFGENISEKLKAAKTIQKSGDDLKNQPKPASKFYYLNKNNRGRLNYKPQHRKTDPKPATSSSVDSGRARQSRAPARGTHQRYSRRSPTRRTTHK